jgi:hypothetical protein
VTLKWSLKKQGQRVGVDWINMAQDRDNQQALDNVLGETSVPRKTGNFLIR